MGEQMKNAPVYFVIGQVRFNPSPKPLNEKIVGIQEGFRELGFADYKHQKMQQMSLSIQGDSFTRTPGDVLDLYEFANPERTMLFSLDPNQLSFQTVAYTTSEDFADLFSKALNLLTENVQLQFIERVSLRFLDAVMPRKGEDLKTYVHPQLLGLSGITDELVTEFSLSEAVMRLESELILTRVILMSGKIGFPQDLANVSLEIKQKFREYEGPFAILDNDAFHEKRLIFKPKDSVTETVIEILGRLKNLIDTMFHKSVTQAAKDIWKGEV